MSADSQGTTDPDFTAIMEPSILSLGYLAHLEESASYYEECDQCIVPQHLWRTWIEDQEDGSVLLVELTQGDHTKTLCVGGSTTESNTTVFLPKRCFQEFSISEPVSVKVQKTMPPLATKLVLQPLDNVLYHCNIVDTVSKYLSEWQVLTKWTILSIPCEELGGFPVELFVKEVEPADIVLLRNEVPLELAEPLESVVEWALPTQEPLSEPSSIDSSSTLCPPFLEEEPEPQTGFIPFSGTGHRLGN
jgi:hypothetical protein